MTKHSTFRRNLIWQYGLQLLKYILPLATLPYLTRVLTPETYSIVAYVAAVMAYVQVFVDFGFNLSGTKRIASASSAEDASTALGEITFARLVLSVGALMALLLFALCVQITRDNLLFTMVFFLATCVRVMAPDFVFQGYEDLGPITTRYLLTKGTSTVLTFVLVRSPGDLLWIPALDLAGGLFAAIWTFLKVRSMFGLRVVFPNVRGVLSEIGNSATYCFSNVAATSLSVLITIMVGVTSIDRTQVAFWSLGITVIGAVQSLYNPVVAALYPHMVRTRDFSFLRRIGWYSLPLVALSSLMLGAFSDQVFVLLGGAQYREGSYVVALLSPMLLFSFYAILFGWPLLGAAGRIRDLTASTIAASLFCVACICGTAFFGLGSIVMLCIVRVFVEVVLFGLRFYFAFPYLKRVR